MSLIVRAFPLKAPVAQLHSFLAALHGERKEEMEDFYGAHGVTHESWYLQETEHGPWVIGLTQVQQVEEAAPRFQQADSGFAAWFKEQVKALSGVDPTVEPLGPPTTLVHEWSATEACHAMFCPPDQAVLASLRRPSAT